jgi:hypothetical protein
MLLSVLVLKNFLSLRDSFAAFAPRNKEGIFFVSRRGPLYGQLLKGAKGGKFVEL